MFPRLARCLVALAAAAAAALVLAGAAQAEAVSPGAKKVAHKMTGLALSVVGHDAGVAPGAYLTLAPYQGKASQKWTFVATGDGRYKLRNGKNAGLCAAPNASGSLYLTACANGAWILVSQESGGGKSLRPYAGGPAAGSFGEHQNVFFDALEVGVPDFWHMWVLTSASTAPPPDDPWPPVCNVKPSLPQCNL